jgi:hypothetical protein
VRCTLEVGLLTRCQAKKIMRLVLNSVQNLVSYEDYFISAYGRYKDCFYDPNSAQKWCPLDTETEKLVSLNHNLPGRLIRCREEVTNIITGLIVLFNDCHLIKFTLGKIIPFAFAAVDDYFLQKPEALSGIHSSKEEIIFSEKNFPTNLSQVELELDGDPLFRKAIHRDYA